MQISSPLYITSRLLPGCGIGGAEISIEYSSRPAKGRQRYHWRIDLSNFEPESEFEGDDLCSGVGGGSLQEGLESLLGFLGAFAEAIAYQERTGRKSENAGLFPAGLVEWASENADEIVMMELELQENPGELIKETH